MANESMMSTDARTAPDGLPIPQRHWAMSTLLLGIALCVLDGTMMSLALPDIAGDLRVTPAEVIGVINAYQVSILALLLPLAALADVHGPRRLYLVGVAVLGLASIGCLFAPNLPTLIAARALQGAGAACIFAVNTALVRAIYPRAVLGRGIALNSMTVATASVAGPPLAASLLSAGSWHLLFGINVPLTLMVLALGWRNLPSTHQQAPTGGRLSWLDVTLNAALFSMLYMGATELLPRPETPPDMPRAAALLLGAAAVGIVYVRRQQHLAVPLLPLDLLRIPVFRLSMCTSVGSFGAQTLSSIALPFLLLGQLHYSHAEAGAVLAAWPLATIATAPVAGWLIGRIPDGLIAGAGLLLMSAGLWLTSMLAEHATLVDIAWRLALCGVGFGLFQAPNNHTIVTSAPVNRVAATGGMLASARLSGQTLGALTLALLFAWPGLSQEAASPLALAVSAAFAFVAALFSVLRVRSAATPSAR